MGLVNWCQDRWLMMMRTKPYYISILGRKRSSVKSPKLSPFGEGKYGRRFGAFMCVVTMCCSISYGVLLVLSDGLGNATLPTHLLSVAVAGIVTISGGICLAEYINAQSQETASIYSCCYQYSSEVLAFFIGWTWIMSQTAVISAICKVLTTHVNDWTDDAPRKFLENIFHDYAKDVPSLILVLILVFFTLTGFGETMVWYALFIPIAFMMIVAGTVISYVMNTSELKWDGYLSWNNVGGIDQILKRSVLCILFFSGPQSILRIPVSHTRKNIIAVLGPLNAILLIIAFFFVTAATLTMKTMSHSSSNELMCLISNILCTISLCSLGIEAFYPLHFVIEDMASDGLLFRSLSKKWKPFCFPVASAVAHVLSFVTVGAMAIFMPLTDVLNLAVLFPLLINTIVPFLVLLQRYRDNSTWQYEPMFHASARNISLDRSRKKSLEFQYSSGPGFDITEEHDIPTTCLDLSDTSSSDTDIDAAVQQYKDQTRIISTPILEDPTHSSQPSEPTPTSFFRAKLFIVLLIVISLIVSVILNFAASDGHFSVIVIILICVLFSTIVQGLLVCLPQNQNSRKEKKCCRNMPNMPWTPGIASLISSSLLLHSLIQTWKVCLGCFIMGAFLYFLYGIRSSTAANSFYNMRTTHITLRPLPSYGNNCIPQIVPSQRKVTKSRKLKRSKSDL